MSRRARTARASEASVEPEAGAPVERARLDQWLWRARFYKTRGLAAEACAAGKIRVNGARTRKPGCAVKLGDALTFVRGGRVHTVEIVAFGERRGPAPEARGLYRDLAATDGQASAADDPAGESAAPGRGEPSLDDANDLT